MGLNRLLSHKGTVKTDVAAGFIIGDAGVLSDRGELTALRAPLSSSVALYLTLKNNPTPVVAASQHEVESLSLESAARSRG